MTDQFVHPDGHADGHPTADPGAAIPSAVEPEHVGRGVLAALGGVAAGVVVTVVLWRLGYVAAISGVVLAWASVRLYTAVAGTAPRRGLVPLVLLIVVGALVSFLAVVASDALDFYSSESLEQEGVSRLTFLTDNLTDLSILGAYGRDMAMFFVFAILGAGGTIWQVVKKARAT